MQMDRFGGDARLAVSIEDTCELTSLRRTLVYGCLKDGRLTRRKVGRRTLVTMASIRQLLADDEAI